MAYVSGPGGDQWGRTNEYDQPFVIGTNIVGVLPGADPGVADEYVLLCARHDHLGVDDGQVHPGAADNASGLSLLLEAAEHLALGEHRPRQIICFAAFDAEERGLFGACAFTSRPDFRPEQLAGVVNVDLVGRKIFDVVDNVVLAFGTETFFQL